MSKPIQTVEELAAVLHWRGKHAQAIRERDALQQLLNQRDEQIETMKQYQGEAVAWRYREGEGAQWRLTDMPPSTWYFDPRQYELRKLYEKPAPVARPLDYGSLDAVQRLAVCRGDVPAEVPVVPELTSELRWILGQMCFQHIHTAQALRLMGHEIDRKAEDEQAVTIYWMLGHYLKDPANWRDNAAAEMKAAAPKA